MASFLLDTDILIDHLADPAKKLPSEYRGAAYSSITRAELYSGQHIDEAVIDRLLEQFEEIPVERSVAEEAGRIRRITKIKLPDALIAATAITSKRRLVTRNVRDFGRVKRLTLHRSG